MAIPFSIQFKPIVSVLYVDYSLANRMYFQQLVREMNDRADSECGYVCEVAQDGSDARHLFEARPNVYSVIVIDFDRQYSHPEQTAAAIKGVALRNLNRDVPARSPGDASVEALPEIDRQRVLPLIIAYSYSDSPPDAECKRAGIVWLKKIIRMCY